jgi:dihydropyrimidinase
MFGLYPRKGSLEIGSDADIVIFDPGKKVILNRELLHENVDYTPYEGIELVGYPLATLSQGRIIVRDGEYIADSPSGRYLRRTPFMKAGQITS